MPCPTLQRLSSGNSEVRPAGAEKCPQKREGGRETVGDNQDWGQEDTEHYSRLNMTTGHSRCFLQDKLVREGAKTGKGIPVKVKKRKYPANEACLHTLLPCGCFAPSLTPGTPHGCIPYALSTHGLKGQSSVQFTKVST